MIRREFSNNFVYISQHLSIINKYDSDGDIFVGFNSGGDSGVICGLRH